MEDVENNENENEISIRLKSGFNLSELVSSDGATFEVNFDDIVEEPQNLCYDPEEISDLSKDVAFTTYGDDGCLPFSEIEQDMVDVDADGMIKKQVIRPGSGVIIPQDSFVTIHYNAYMEYNDEPFDSTYIRKKPLSFELGDSTTILGLDFAVRTMKVNEKSRFLIKPQLAYGSLGCLDRVQPNSTILFEIEVKNCIDSGAAKSFSNLAEERQKNFEDIYRYCLALCAKGNELFSKGLYKQASREYNQAMSKLEHFHLKDHEEQVQQQKLLLRLRTNAVVCYTKMEIPKLACSHCNRIYSMCTETELKVPPKIYFNHARCLIMLNELNIAEVYLKRALDLEPQNNYITKEFIKLDALRKKQSISEKKLCEAMMSGLNKVDEDFKYAVADLCKTLNSKAQDTEYPLPGKLNWEEKDFVKKTALEYGLFMRDCKETQTCFICKK